MKCQYGGCRKRAAYECTYMRSGFVRHFCVKCEAKARWISNETIQTRPIKASK